LVSRQEPIARVVLLGASNLTRGISTVVELAQSVCGGPAEYLIALGHGRSYGQGSTVLGRWLPGIVPCALWESIRAAPHRATYALVTDIGNDLMYEAPVDKIAGWVDECCARLEDCGARMVITGLPLANIATLSPQRYELFRGAMFPRCSLALGEIESAAMELNERVEDLARRRGGTVVSHCGTWYGWDPIHIRKKIFPQAWRRILAPWVVGGTLPPAPHGSLRRWLYLRSRVPYERRIGRLTQRRAQPCGRLSDGSTIALF
jgi:hypothetical protein